jgi:hypothetical protein
LVYFGLRYYDPATGQWLSREPLGEGESLNLYAYAHNDPINRVDVLGAEEAWHAKMQRAMMDQNYAMDHNGLNRSGNPVGDIYIRMGEADRLTSAQRVFGNVAGALIERDPSEVALSPGAPLGRGLAHNLQLLGDTWAMEFLEMKTLAEAPGRFFRDEAVPEHMVAGREAYLKAYTIGERDTASTTLLAGSLFGPSLAAKGSRFTAGLFEQTASSLSRLSVPTIRTVPGEVFCLTPRIKIGFGPPVAKAPQGLKWVRDMQKGRRPHPAAYLSVGERKAIESAFDQGAVRFTSYSNIKKFGTAGSGDAFVFPKSHFDRVIAEAGGNLRLIERRLGLPAGYLGDTDTVAAFIERNDFSRLRIATGNEHGADLDFWIPGGTTSGGVPEVILDLSQTPFTIVPFR